MTGKTASQKKVKVSARIDRGLMDFFKDDQDSEKPIFKSFADFMNFSGKLTQLLSRGPAGLKRLAEALTST